jgi:hypothetical protein
MKYLTLIQAIALLHQHQREAKTVEHGGQVLRYIEATTADIELANRIAHEVLGRTLDELPPQTRRLLNLIRAMVAERARSEGIKPAQVRFTRRDVRDFSQWSDSQLKLHCARLADMEFLLIHGGSRGHSLRYELLWDGGDEAERRRHLCGLIDTTELGMPAPVRQPQVWAGGAQVDAKSGPSLGQVWAKSGPQKLAQVVDAAEQTSPVGRNGVKTHILGEAPSAAGPVVVAAGSQRARH